MDHISKADYQAMAKKMQELAITKGFYYIPLSVYGRELRYEYGVLPEHMLAHLDDDDNSNEEYDYYDYSGDDDDDTGADEY